MSRAVWSAWILAAIAAAGSVAMAQTPMIGGKPYVRLATREETRGAMMAALTGSGVVWGEWRVLGPIDHAKGGKNIDKRYPPEAELSRMKAGGAGPDLDKQHDGKGGRAIAWRAVEERNAIGGTGGLAPINLREGLEAEAAEMAVAYAYRRVTADRDCTVRVGLGSDDGLRAWVNGELVVDANEERPLNTGQHVVEMRLRKGVNHVLAKVSQGKGEWQFQLTFDESADPVAEAALNWQLDEDFPDAETRYYRLATVPHPRAVSAEVGGLDVMPDGSPALCTRRGEVYVVAGAYDTPAVEARWQRIASGLQEPLGLRVVKSGDGLGFLIAQRAELTRIEMPTDGRMATRFETVCDDWQITGNYHEYAFGPKFDARGDAWVNLNLAHTGGETTMGATIPTRGWAVRVPISRPGPMEKVADGLRSPDGIGIGPDGEMFYTDNQGDYVATNKLCHLKPGGFYGHQASLKFREGYGSHWNAEGKPVPEITWPAVWFPYKKMGQSASDILLDDTGGRFGPFAGQMFVGDQTTCEVFRVFLERVGGEYQGACFPFRRGLASGVHRLAWGKDGSMFVGMTDRGWGSTGPKREGLQRLAWTGRVPLEILAMRARVDGFVLEFTRDVGDEAMEPGRYAFTSYTYNYHPAYGSDEMETKAHSVVETEREGPRSVRLRLDEMRSGGMGYVYELKVNGLMAMQEGRLDRESLLHDRAYYTVQRLPER
ncbi:MAG: hypothetical protein ACKVW3_08065 [Phycisphaerales bacterium]